MPYTKSELVERARRRLIARGGWRIPPCALQPDAAAALRRLLDAGYAYSIAGAVARAITEADQRENGPDK